MKHIILAQPRGFCAGVQRAVDIVDSAIEKFQQNFVCNLFFILSIYKNDKLSSLILIWL